MACGCGCFGAPGGCADQCRKAFAMALGRYGSQDAFGADPGAIGLPPGYQGGKPAAQGDDEAPYAPGPPPHADDWWVSTGDVVRYAQWLNPRVKILLNASQAWPDPLLRDQLLQWNRSGWQPFYGELTDNWLSGFSWDGLFAWDDVRAYHKQLIDFASQAKSRGYVVPVEIEAVPQSPDEKVVLGAGKAASTALDVAVWVGLGIGGLWALDHFSKRR